MNLRNMSFAVLLVLALSSAVGCKRQRATLADCQEILDRLVELEMRERGFRDPVLLEHRRQELRRVLEPDVRECQGKPISSGALACVRNAPNPEQISHHCLR
jgi:hypothetical protein